MPENNNAYHHGNLRQSLINRATELIAASGIEQLSMRHLAQIAGVSRTAAYHHFKDKNALLCAIAEQGFEHWLVRFAVLLDQKPEPLHSWLTDFVMEYIDFACDHPEEYDLMFGRPIWKAGEPTASLRQKSADCFHLYVEFIAKWQQRGIFSAEVDALRLAQVSWSTLHGICRLLNDGIYLDRSSVDAMCMPVVNMLIANVGRPPM